jgi:tetratricopeptide (TPR) repeat protein
MDTLIYTLLLTLPVLTQAGVTLGRLVVFITVLGVSLAGCGSTAQKLVATEFQPEYEKTTAPVRPPARKPSSDINPYAFDCFVNATVLEQVGDLPAAAELYKAALQYYPTSYEIRYSLALTHFKMGRYRDVLSILETIKPESLPVLDIRAACLRTSGMSDSARSTYLRILQLDPDDGEAYMYLAEAYRQLNHPDSMGWVLENLTRLHPHSYRFPLELGRLRAEEGKTEEAKEWFWKSLELTRDATNLLSFVGLSHIYENTGKLDSAVAVLKEGLQVAPSEPLLYLRLTSVYAGEDSLQAALQSQRKVVQLAPLDRTQVRYLGILYYNLDSLRLADSIFTSLVKSGDGHVVSHAYLALVRLEQKNYAEAISEFTIVTQLADTVALSWLQLGQAYQLSGNRDKEIETYRQGLSRVKDEPLRLLFALAVVYEQTGKITESMAAFEEIIAKDPKNAGALNYLGYMLADRGERLEYARALIERAIEISPETAAYQDSYGWVFYRLGDYEKAITHLRKAASLDNDPVILDHLGDALNATGNTDEARSLWQKALELQPDNNAIKEKLGR